MNIIRAVIVVITLFPAYAAAQGTPEQQNACMGDAFKFCGDYIPDATKIEACLRTNVKIISPECGALVSPKNNQRLKTQPVVDRHRAY